MFYLISNGVLFLVDESTMFWKFWTNLVVWAGVLDNTSMDPDSVRSAPKISVSEIVIVQLKSDGSNFKV